MKKTTLLLMAGLTLMSSQLWARSPAMRAGEAYVTRFSGVTPDPETGLTMINPNGKVGAVFNLRSPGAPPSNHHWIDEPQRNAAYAKDAGQVFGIAISPDRKANVYLAATSRFGLHRNANNSGWMHAQWGEGGGPGTIYILQAKNDYQPQLFTNVTLNGRRNTGAALGNIVIDKRHHQLFVSDLESGMIFRIDSTTGRNKGYFNQGTVGRASFYNVARARQQSLRKVAFNPSTKAKINNCSRKFDVTPKCWNLATPVRRVYGLGLYRMPSGKTRLFYAVNVYKNDKQSAIWSVGLMRRGDFNKSDVRLEFKLPKNTGDTNSSVSDIAFSNSGDMLVAESGPFRNLGLSQEEPFTTPHNARLFLYGYDDNGTWHLKGRYNVGSINQSNNENAFKSTSSAGGADFSYGYNSNHKTTTRRPDQFVWTTGDALCSPMGPCFDINTQQFSDQDEVHGIQGIPTDSYIRSGAIPGYMLDSYMVDTDQNLNADGSKNQAEATRNDATKIGDVEVAKSKSRPPVVGTPPIIVPPIIIIPGHSRLWSHYKRWSHTKYRSHYKYRSHSKRHSHRKFRSHRKWRSHKKYRSHSKKRSHYKYKSYTHTKKRSHRKYRSHSKTYSHFKYKSYPHTKQRSHFKTGSQQHPRTMTHARSGSHNRRNSLQHSRQRSHYKTSSTQHSKARTHARTGSHDRKRSHNKDGSHSKVYSDDTVHSKTRSHYKTGSRQHSKRRSHYKTGSRQHSKARTHARTGSHSRQKSHYKVGSTQHSRVRSHTKRGTAGVIVPPKLNRVGPRGTVKPWSKQRKPSRSKPSLNKKVPSKLNRQLPSRKLLQ